MRSGTGSEQGREAKGRRAVGASTFSDGREGVSGDTALPVDRVQIPQELPGGYFAPYFVEPL